MQDLNNLFGKLRRELLEFKQQGNQDGFLYYRGIIPALYSHAGSAETPYRTIESGLTSSRRLFDALIRMLAPEAGAVSTVHEGLCAHHHAHPSPPCEPQPPGLLILNGLQPYSVFKRLIGIISLRNIIPRLDPQTREALFVPQFLPHGRQLNKDALPVSIFRDRDDPVVLFYPEHVEPLSLPAQRALQKLNIMLPNHRRWINLQCGDLLIVDSGRSLPSFLPSSVVIDGGGQTLSHIFISKEESGSHSFGYETELCSPSPAMR